MLIVLLWFLFIFLLDFLQNILNLNHSEDVIFDQCLTLRPLQFVRPFEQLFHVFYILLHDLVVLYFT